MNKTTVQLPGNQGDWGSYISKYQPDSQKVLDNMFTANSKNFVTDITGMIDKRQGGVKWNRTDFGNVAQDTYEAVFESGARHFLRVGGGILTASTGTGLFDTITAGYSTIGNFEWVTYQNRTYGCNGINPPQVYDIATNYGGVTYSFTTGKTKDMGAQAPLTTPTVGTPTAGGAVPTGAHRYQVTFLYYGAEESNGSPISASQTATSGFQTIPLTNIPVGGYGVTARRIYRDNAGDNNFLLVTQINDNTTTTFSDTLLQGSTPTPIPQFNNVPPTFNKCALWLDSIFIAPSGETNGIRYSNSGSPDVFDPDNFITCQSDDIVTALYVYNGKLYVFGLHSLGTIEGTTPDTFYYHNLNNKIGCVDNRSIQVRSIVSIPTLWWLSDKGLYYSNGYTVEYGSDFIQDLVELNIAQVNYSTNKNTQTSFTDFAGDTYTPSIDINSQPGSVTTINPLKEFNANADWVGGSVKVNLKTSDANLAEVPVQFAPTAASGATTGSVVASGSTITLQSSTPFTGETSNYFGRETIPGGFNNRLLAVPIIPPVSGTVTSWSFVDGNDYHVQYSSLENPANFRIRWRVFNDAGGVPGSDIYVGPWVGIGSFDTDSGPTGFHFNGGQRYWYAMELDPNAGYFNGMPVKRHPNNFIPGPYPASGGWSLKYGAGGWQALTTTEAGGNVAMPYNYGFSADAISGGGNWTSPVYDSGSDTAVSDTVTLTSSYPSGTSVTLTVYASANSNMSSAVSQVFSNPNGTQTLTLSGYRYWQIVEQLYTSNNLNVPSTTVPLLAFNQTGTWVSQTIDATIDNAAWQTLTYTGNIPAGTTATVTIATSADDITYSSFGPIGSAVASRYAKVQLVMTTSSDNSVSPSVSSIQLGWLVNGTITSSIIDTGTSPAGFGVFQWSEVNLNVGVVTVYIRTAATTGAIPSATWVAVSNGTFPALTALRYVQWKAILTSTANTTPVITDITVNWYIGTGKTGVRCSSVFYNKTYYLSVATIGATANNTLIQLDQFGKWRIQKDASVGTFMLYFNSLYFTDGITDSIYNGFIAATDNGTPIVMDVRTKAWASTNDIFLKVPRGLKITGLHTGTLLRAFYSYDRGQTWIEMLNENGQTGYQTNASKTEFVTLFVPDASTLVSGRTLIYRMVSADQYPCSIINFAPSFYTRRGRYLANG